MILENNRKIIEALSPEMFEKVSRIDNPEFVTIQETNDGHQTVLIERENQKKYLHSKYNPIREASAIAEQIDEIDEKTAIIFYGTGLGYHIQQILEKNQNIKYYIYEPIPELLNVFLSNVNLKKYSLDRIMGVNITFSEKEIGKLIERNPNNIKLVVLPSHQQIFPEKYDDFHKMFINLLKGKKTSLHTEYAYQKRWIMNSLRNFEEVLSTPNIILEKQNYFKGKTALLISAGPSLNDEIDNLRKIKESESAYIFSVGSAVNTLIHHKVYPHAACTYDPTEHNQKVFETIKKLKINDIPMIFGSSVGYETIKDYPGEKVHMITSQDTVSNYFLKSKKEKALNIVSDAPSIAVVTLQLLTKLGFNRIILVGQNLAYLGKERYSDGISYGKKVTNEEMDRGNWIKDVYGQDILTNETFNLMRQQMENYIAYSSGIEVINTTRGGAQIKGTKYCELDDLMQSITSSKGFEKKWLNTHDFEYDDEYLNIQLRKMNNAYKKVLKINVEYKLIISKIKKSIENRNYKKAEGLYSQLDKKLIEIERNDFYKVFILPMNRVQYKILADSIDSLNEERNLEIKGKKIIISFKTFIEGCMEDVKSVHLELEKLKISNSH